MQILFLISLLCFAVLLWAGISIARHIRKGPAAPASPRERERSSRPASSPAPEAFHQTIRQITAGKVWNTPSVAVEIPPAPAESPARRKPPYSVTAERTDWAYFNKDYGDLTDPYEDRPRRSRTNIAIPR